MIRKLILAMVLAAFIMPMALAAENASISDMQTEMRIAHLELMTSVKQIEMGAAVSYINEIGGNSSKLSELLDKFSNQSAKISNMSSASDIDSAVKDLKSTVSSFKTEARKQIDANNGKILDLASRIENATSQKSAEIKDAEDNYYTLNKANSLAILDKRVDSAQKSLDKLNQSGLDVSDMQEKLDDVSSLRTELKSALEKRNDSLLESVDNQILNLSKELQNLTSSGQAEAAEKTKLDFWMNTGDRISKSVKTAISELKDEDINVTALEDANDRIKDNLDDTEKALEKDDAKKAKTALKDLKANLENVSASYKEIAGMKKGASNVMKGKLEALNAALDKVVKALGSEL